MKPYVILNMPVCFKGFLCLSQKLKIEPLHVVDGHPTLTCSLQTILPPFLDMMWISFDITEIDLERCANGIAQSRPISTLELIECDGSVPTPCVHHRLDVAKGLMVLTVLEMTNMLVKISVGRSSNVALAFLVCG